ncbi:Brp/Blh family beta-carotene 15,15'-dioxygenase [Algoriphagus antarcticus]|uniref:Probable beta-carotene 15,15'-dioxygenase n=1 Tax=Algoriphagus antarcticus TaxID=238540 RepID=A0A3E0E8V1_9BACT|nr:Brp/Blh family beta-carotene 15,15'-dioxygenase [Algoriphagus antarcticus]REG94684.1 Brp/Blh family beta-carotene 15,15'-monooxygenase [Algoriphagus antarcticus]
MNRVELFSKTGGLFLCILFIFLPKDDQTFEYIFFSIVLIIVGIPHGAIDHLTSDPQINKKGLLRFLLLYISLISIYLLSWIYLPVPALLAFILMSAYHFGQTHFINRTVKNKFKVLLYVSRGLYFLLLILAGDLSLTKSILSPIAKLPDVNLFYILPFFLVATVVIQWFSTIKFNRYDLLELAILGPILFLSPLMISFIVYFGFWHALPSMTSEYEFLKKYPGYNTFKKFSKHLLPFSAISIVGIALTLIIGINYLDKNELILIFFVLISLISFPHILYMDRFWNKTTNTDQH